MAGKKEQLKDYAFQLFKQGLTQKEIASKCGVTEKTIGDWKTKGSWERVKASLMITRDQQLTDLYNQLADINLKISTRPEGERHANSKEMDAISKYAAAIKKLQVETGLSEIVSVARKICDYARSCNDIEAARFMSEWFDRLIQETARK